MLDTFIKSFRLKNTYKVNSIIYSLREIPLVNKILPYNLYENEGLKLFGNIISSIIELIKTFLGKLLYVLLLVFLPTLIYKNNQTDIFLHIFTFLILAFASLSSYIIKPTKDKYYAVVIMNFDAKKYATSDYYYYLLKNIVGFMPFTIIFGLLSKEPLWICILILIFYTMVNTIMMNYDLYTFSKTNNVKKNVILSLIFTLIFIVSSYVLPFYGLVISRKIFMVIFIISLILGIISFIKINKFKDYKRMYKKILTTDNVSKRKKSSSQLVKERISKEISYEEYVTSNRKGFAYFHDLFVKRHSSILTKAVRTQFFVILLIFIPLIFISIINYDFREYLNEIPLTFLPYFVFVMYILNRGTTLTQAMFMNCDHSMLTYKFYRKPKVILGLFKERLKTLIKLNLLPALAIGLGLVILLYTSGGTDNILNYFVLFVSIISMSIFFSVHYLVMYYLLQPYNVNTELKSGTYKFVQGLTYAVCYFMIDLHLSTIPFGIATIIFSILYSLVSLLFVYKFAFKTFKLRN